MSKLLHHAFSRAESTDRPSEFFVEAATPKHFDSGSEESSVRLQRAVTMGDPNAQVDFLVTPTPEIDLKLLPKKLLVYVALAVVFYVAFTVVFYIGITVDTVYEAIGTSKKSEEVVETFNTYSGYAMAMVEVFVAMHTDKFMPVLDVYVHNSLFFLQRGTDGKPKSKSSRRLHTVLLFLFPVVLGLTMGNSLRGLQASQSSNGFQRIMNVDDMKKEQPMLELIKANANAKAGKNATNSTAVALSSSALRGVNDIILKNAIRQQSTPFTFDTKSACGLNSSSSGGDDKEVADIINSAKNSQKASRIVKLNTHELDSTSVVYGFVPQEWNSEAFAAELTPKTNYTITYAQVLEARKTKTVKIEQPSDFSLATAFEMFVQAKILIERAHGDAAVEMYECSQSDGRTDQDLDFTDDSDSGSKSADAGSTRKTATMMTKKVSLGARLQKAAKRRLQESSTSDDGDDYEFEEDPPSPWLYNVNGSRLCEGAISSLFNMSSFVNRTSFKAEDLVVEATAAIAKTMPSISRTETKLILEKYNLTDQIHVEAMRIEVPMDKSVEYGLESDCEEGDKDCQPLYLYDSVQESFCGSNSCAFVDTSRTFMLQKEIGIIPYFANCSLSADSIHYSSDFRGFYPNDCKKVANTVLLYGFGSYISGEEYGSNDTRRGTGAPYILKPRRQLRFTVAKVTWKTENLAAAFNATCGISKQNVNCTGLWHQLQPSGRYLFAGEDALTTTKLGNTDFRAPIPLVQLNSPTLYVERIKGLATLERVAPKYFDKSRWTGKAEYNGSALGREDCSMLMDSYLKQVEDNNYFLERPLQAMYTSFFYYFMENAAVTQLNDTSIALNGTNTTVKGLRVDRLGNVKLKGDKQVRSIRVSIPTSSFYTTLGGCVFILILSLLILVVPARRVEYFAEDTTKAQQFIAMRDNEAYPDAVLTKTLLFPLTNESVPFDDVEIERVALVHEAERDRMVYL